MKVITLKPVQSPFVERKKLLKPGSVLTVNDDLGREWIGDKKAKPATKEDELKAKVNEKSKTEKAIEKKEIEKR